MLTAKLQPVLQIESRIKKKKTNIKKLVSTQL